MIKTTSADQTILMPEKPTITLTLPTPTVHWSGCTITLFDASTQRTTSATCLRSGRTRYEWVAIPHSQELA